jgi:hypothetical protein
VKAALTEATKERETTNNTVAALEDRLVVIGLKAKGGRAQGNVCFTPESGHVRCNDECLLWANSGHCQ